jgi:hypothetical protein
MGNERVEDEMIESGDPSVETTAAEPPPRVVLEYRERGVPWMLVPPMVVLSAVAAVMVYSKLSPPPRPVRVSAPSEPMAVDPVAAAEAPGSPSPTQPGPSSAIEPQAESRSVPASPFELAMERPSITSPSTAPAEVPAAGAIPQEPAPFPRVQGLGFDPRALVDPEPPVDQAVAPVAGPQDPPAREALPAIDPGGRAQPEEVDPDVLPVDPREARRRRDLRVVEARRKAEADRGRFHAELRAICRKPGEKAVPEIDELCKKYGMDVDPAIKSQAARLLEVSAAGAGREVRINLLRSLGFSEPVILHDIFESQGRWDNKATRGGPRSKEQVMYQSALLLLGYPPTRVASPSRPVSTTRAAR